MPEFTPAAFLGLAAGCLSMFLYSKLTPQAKLAELKANQKKSRKTLANYDGDLSGLFPLITDDLSITLRQLRIVLFPAIISIAPCMVPFFIAPQSLQSTSELIAYFTALLIASIYIKLKFNIL